MSTQYRESLGTLPEAKQQISVSRKIQAYFQLTKPRVIELLLVCTVPTMFLAAQGVPNLWLVFITVLGGALSAGSAGAFNCYFDADIDKKMKRTENRPLVTGELSMREAFIFATVLGVLSIAVLWIFTNFLTAMLSLIAIFFYVVIYTLVLKRRTEQNIIWGGIAGCMPVLIGWAAVTNDLSWAPVILFLIIFLWTPPHYWPLSMRYEEDYAAVDVPMISVVRNRSEIGIQIILYAWATVAASLLLIPIAHMGLVYSITAIATGIWFLFESHLLYSNAIRGVEGKPMRVFHGSISYLSLLFVAVGIDPLLPF
ncbi:MAG: heme o synthase [Microbacteriaceae bacterium]